MKMVNKKVRIEFADPRINAIDAISDIRKAAENAAMNLNMRYDIQLQYPMPENGMVTVGIRIPEDQAEGFAFGNRLRGISSYLLKNCNGKYNQYLVGKRLLTYTEIKENPNEKKELTMAERFEAIASFARLLERNDAEAVDKINRISRILREEG
jgi:hypothetical protein